MGFLDRMVGNLVSDATGIDRRLVRKLVGNKSLMMLGAGAALGGGAMAGLAGKQQPGSSTGPSTWDNPNRIEQATGTAQPPPPPPRSQGTTPPKPPGERTAPPPPPPPPPGAVPPAEQTDEVSDEAAPDAQAVEKAAEELEEPIEEQLPRELTYGLVRTMVAAALADGDLSDDERDMIHGQLDESGLADDEVKQIQRDLVLPPSVQDLAEMAGEEEAWKESMYRFAGFVILADEKVSDLERSWLDRLAGALGFTDEQKDALETEIFAAG